ncbi:hypothetical protein B0H66DRAFT_233188 [Apodospora peruviana]|uniref:Pyridoxamine 5'-phosphate oxidase Alr4036 family FMN-binding domain-containing protein n=1 Tax=Apodospora peruviana TaxID=516989 RepID=A0AAE0I4M8_9PEZI|nr:hypothetical protein B0H66DRAFT_233188 [Apodospora peruviana]
MSNHQETPCTPAPWLDEFVKHISSMAMPTFVLSTLHPATTGVTGPSFTDTPRARTCVYRGLWATPLTNDRNPAPRNPAIFESDLPVFTTDVRMEKVSEIFDTAVAAGVGASGNGSHNTGSGGGGPVEAVYWASEYGTQWRVRGTAWILGPDIDNEDGPEGGAHRVRSALRGRMMRKAAENITDVIKDEVVAEAEKEWSWSREVAAHFGNLSPGMRGTFRHPPPGRPVAEPIPPGSGLGVGQTVEDLDDPVARKNFRVVVIIPTEVDQADVSDPKRPRRWLYTYRSKSYKSTMYGGEVIGEWGKVEIWP